MKTKLFKRIGALVLACMMCFALCSTAFAVEDMSNLSEKATSNVYDNLESVPTPITISPGKTEIIEFKVKNTLSSGMWILTNSPRKNFNVSIKVYNKSDNSNVYTNVYNWTVGCNDYIEKNVTFLGGTVKLEVRNTSSNDEVSFYVGWT